MYDCKQNNQLNMLMNEKVDNLLGPIFIKMHILSAAELLQDSLT